MRPVLLFLLVIITGYAQRIPVEISSGDHHYRYQHSLLGSYNEKLGYSHVSSILNFYDGNDAEIMTQSYFTYWINKQIAVGIGTFYASVPGFTPAVNIQFSKTVKAFTVVIVPRVDLKDNPSYELMAFVEYSPKKETGLQPYGRIQLMENFTGLDHNRSYQYLRLGLSAANMQFGISVDYDAYRRDMDYISNYGVFLRSVFK